VRGQPSLKSCMQFWGGLPSRASHLPLHTFPNTPFALLLHSGKDLAVSSPKFLLELAQHITSYVLGASPLSGLGVSVRTSNLTVDGYYPLPLPCPLRAGRVFGLSSAEKSRSDLLKAWAQFWGGLTLISPQRLSCSLGHGYHTKKTVKVNPLKKCLFFIGPIKRFVHQFIS